MRTFLPLLAVLLPLALAETDSFKATVVSGKTKLKCTFTMVYTDTKVDTKKSKAKCSGARATTRVSNAEVVSSSGAVFTISMTVPKSGNAKFQKVSMALGSSSGSEAGSGGPPGKGSGSGGPPGKGSASGGPPGKGSGSGGPPGKGSGSGGPPGKGSGSGGPPGKGSGSGGPGGPPGSGSGAPGQGSGQPGMMKCRCKCTCPDGSEDCDCECDCPTGQTSSRSCGRGFSRVCPSQDDGACPARMAPLCSSGVGMMGGLGGGQGSVGPGSGGPPGKGSGSGGPGSGGPPGKGSGSGGPPGKGSGSGGPPGKGSGSGGPPGKGSGERPPKGRQLGPGQENIVGTEIAGDGCTCMPNIILSMVKSTMQSSAGPQGQGGKAGPPTGRAGPKPDKFDAEIVNGRTKLKCKFTLMFKGDAVDTKKSKAKCTGAKKTEKVVNAAVKSKSGAEYSITMTVAKSGSVKFTKVIVTSVAGGSEGSGSSGSGGPGKGSGGPGKGSGSGGPGKGSGGPGKGSGSGGPGKGSGSGGPGGPGAGPGGPNGQMEDCVCIEESGPPGNGPPGQGSGGPGQGSRPPGQGSGGPGQGSGGPGQGSGGPGQGSGGPGQGSGGPSGGSGSPGSTVPGSNVTNVPNPGSAASELTLSIISPAWSQESAGYSRTAKVSVPTTTAGQKVPVVLHLHGNGGQGNTIVLSSWLGEDCVIVSADGYERSWNIFTEKSKADDVAFILELIAKVGAEIPAADMNNVNIIGTSNGAALTYRLMIETGSDRPFRRAFPMVSSLISPQYHDSSFWKSEESAAPGDANVYDTAVVPVFDDDFEYAHFHGTEDGALQYEGQSPGPGFLGGADVISAQTTDFLWAQAMGYTGPQLDDSEGVSVGTDAKPVQQYTYLNGKVRHFKLIGEGHSTGPGHDVVREIVRDAILG